MKYSIIMVFSGGDNSRMLLFSKVLKNIKNQINIDKNDHEIIIVFSDNCPMEISRMDDFKVTQIKAPTLEVFNKSWYLNIGANHATGKWLIFIDADMWFSRSYLSKMEAFINNAGNKRISVSGISWLIREEVYRGRGSIDDALNDIFEERRDPDKWLRHLQDAGGNFSCRDYTKFEIAGGILAISREEFDEVSGYNENFKGYGGEDGEMHSKIIENLCYLPEYVVHPFHTRPEKATDQKQYAQNCFYADISRYCCHCSMTKDRYYELLRKYPKGQMKIPYQFDMTALFSPKQIIEWKEKHKDLYT